MAILFKNTICQKGKVCDANVKMLANYVSPYNATVVEKLAGFEPNTDVSVENDIKAQKGKIALRSTHGVISRYGLISFAATFESIGFVGTDKKDIYDTFKKAIGKDKCDPTSAEYKETLEKKKPVIKENVALASQKYVDAAYDCLDYAEFSTNIAYLDGVRYGVRTTNCKDWEELIRNSRTEGFDEETKRKLMVGTVVVSAKWADEYFKRAKTIQNKIIAEYNEVFKTCDVIKTTADDKTPLFAGLPSVFMDGVQYVGPKYSEKTLLNVGGEF